MNYSEDDKLILNYFFTNIDKDIFVTKNMHPEVWALMQARYSRSGEGLRQSFLKLLKEEPENYKKLINEIETSQSGISYEHAIKKAIQFMEKWVLGYGHSSVAEGAVIGICMENVSILASKVIEDNRLASYIEKSTRYVSFNESSFYFDSDLMNSESKDEIKQLINTLFLVYKDLHNPVLNYIKEIVPYDESTSEAAWKRACAARRFDAIRYLLPACTKTSLGMTVNARQLSYAISKMLSHSLKEVNDIGKSIKEEASKVLPSLLRFANPKDYFSKTETNMMQLVSNIEFDKNNDYKVRLVREPNDADNMVIASIIYRYSNESFDSIMFKVRSMSQKEKEKIFDSFLENMSDFDHPLRELEHINFSFDIIMDYGAFRDLQRHRICTQTTQLLTADLGYSIPKDISDSKSDDQFMYVMGKAKELFVKLRDKYPYQAQYILPLGYKKRFFVSMNLRELHHWIKIRTTPLAHESYRHISYLIYNSVKEKYPMLSKYIVCSYFEGKDNELGRLKSEEKTEQLETVGPL